MHPPIRKFNKLSLGASGMAPVTRSQSQGAGDVSVEDAHGPALTGPPPAGRDPGADDADMKVAEDEDEDNHGSDDDNDEDEDDDDGPVRSPLTNLFYNVENLDDETQELVRELFRPPAPDETPPMVIEWCGISNDPDVYAFQLRELVPRTIRIGSPSSRIPRPNCNCTGSETRPCHHLVWLMDQIAKQTLHSHPPDQPLVLDQSSGFPRELGGDGDSTVSDPASDSAYARIADFHIDILASTLHCRAGPPDGRPDQHRVREAREILAGLHGVQDDAGVDTYAPEIFDRERDALERLLWGTASKQLRPRHGGSPGSEDSESSASPEEDESKDEKSGSDGARTPSARGPKRRRPSRAGPSGGAARVRDLVERGDLQQTVLRLLVSNDEFFAMFLKLLAPHDKARDPFRKIQQRVEAVLDALLAVPASSGAGATSTETVSVAWAARHIQNAVEQIRLLLQHSFRPSHHHHHSQPRRKIPPPRWARRSAARALVWIFHALVVRHNRDAHAGATQDDRNLYQRLIGNNDGGGGFFLLDELELAVADPAVPDQGQFRVPLERIRRRIQRNGYRAPFMQRLDGILAQMRAAEGGQPAPVLAAVAADRRSSRSTAMTPPLPPLPAAGIKRQGPSNARTSSDRRPKRAR